MKKGVHLKLSARLLVILTLMIGLFSVNVLAQTERLTDLLRPLQNLNFAEAYMQYWFAIDFILALVIFLAIAKLVFSQRYGDNNQSRALSIGIGITMAFMFIAGERMLNFRLYYLGPYFVIFIILMFPTVLYYYLNTWGGAGRIAMGLFMMVAGGLYFAYPDIQRLLSQLPWAGPWFDLLAIVAIGTGIVLFIMGIVGLFGGGGGIGAAGGGFGGGGAPPAAGGGGGGFHPIQSFRDWRNRGRERRDLREEQQLTTEMTNIIRSMEMRYSTMAGICNNCPYGAIPVNRAFQYIIRNPPGTPVPYLNPQQRNYLDGNRIPLTAFHREWVRDWDRLIGEIDRIATLNEDLRRRVVYQLTRPV